MPLKTSHHYPYENIICPPKNLNFGITNSRREPIKARLFEVIGISNTHIIYHSFLSKERLRLVQ